VVASHGRSLKCRKRSNLGREFKNEEQAENWLTVSESMTAIDTFTRKYAPK
jgi:hypothetical protein